MTFPTLAQYGDIKMVFKGFNSWQGLFTVKQVQELTSVFVDWCFIQLSSERLPPAAYRNRWGDLQPDTVCRKNLNWRLHQTPPLRARGFWGRGGRKTATVRGAGGHQENKTFWIHQARPMWAHRNWRDKHRAYTGLHQALWIDSIAVSLVFPNILLLIT